MTKTCVVKNCKKFSLVKKWGIFGFPLTNSNDSYMGRLADKRRKNWMVALGLGKSCRWRGIYICGRHFVSGKPSRLTDITNLDWTPTLYLPTPVPTPSGSPRGSLSGSISGLHENGEGINVDAGVKLSPFSREETENSRVASSNSLTLDITSRTIEQESSKYAARAEMYRTELLLVQTRCFNMTDRLAMSKRDLDFLVNDAKCNYYTGLQNYQVLKKLYQFLLPSLENPYGSLSKEQIFVMTLTKLRLNTPIQTLAYDYDVCPNTISTYYHRTVYIIHQCCHYALEPTPLSNLQRHTPPEFVAKYGQKRVFIVDCFEVRCETPGNVKAAAMHFSNYKKTETVKFLIAVHPDGTIGFISKSYVGRCSDREMLKQSGFLNLLQENDVVLADKGFNVKDLIDEKKAILNIPTFLRNKTQFLPSELETDKQITKLRIHVERIIGLIRNKYTVVSGVIMVDSMARFQNGLNVVDLVVQVCCILCNFNKSIIPY